MIERYADSGIKQIFGDENKTQLWQQSELAVIWARAQLGEITIAQYEQVESELRSISIDLGWWYEREKDTGHDLAAFLDERVRFISTDLQWLWHKDGTSYDTEELAFARMLSDAVRLVLTGAGELEKAIVGLALKYRYTPMMGVTHGQRAEVQSFGKRCLTWLVDLRVEIEQLEHAAQNLQYSKMSGVIGNYTGISPELEAKALEKLGLKPFYGATQIMPRSIYVPVASALCQLVQSINKIATDIRLGARSSFILYQEPFGKKQKGSSAMPGKKNTITPEQMDGMAMLALGYLTTIMQTIKTWEERAIEQSCVERVAWPDLFHVTINCLKKMTKVLSGLVVYPNNMMHEIHETRGTYAAAKAKEELKQMGAHFGLETEDAYRIIQLAAFNVLYDHSEQKVPASLAEANALFTAPYDPKPEAYRWTICDVIQTGGLLVCPELEADEEQVRGWNKILQDIFARPDNVDLWHKVFDLEELLRNEATIYAKLLNVKDE